MKFLCPICENELVKKDKCYVCVNNHSFDIAKQGYLNLNLKNSQNTGDEKEMIRARNAFLQKDYYLFLKDKLNEIIKGLNKESLLDLACGEGYYTSYFEVKDKLGIDLSKEALKIASRNDKNTTYILKNIFAVPLEDKSMDVITTIFAPVSSEISRLLKDDGYFILVRPDARHLYELKEAVYDKPYLNEIEDVKIQGLKIDNEIKINKKVLLDNTDLNNLFMMTPYYHKTSKSDIAKLESIDTLEVSFEFIIDVYKKDC